MGTVLISTPGDGSLDPAFGAAIYENLLQELAKTKQFKQVFRSGDRNANDLPGLLILKTTVQKYTPGSETRRAVTTVSGATKLNVRIQLSTREGHIVVEQFVEGDVRFIGNNLRTTHNLAHNVAVTLKRSTLAGIGNPGPRTRNWKDVQVPSGHDHCGAIPSSRCTGNFLPYWSSFSLRQHNIFGIFVIAEAEKHRVPQLSILGPFRVGNLSNEFRR